jgi:uncharacterized membrane protein
MSDHNRDMTLEQSRKSNEVTPWQPFRKAVVRGLATLLPPLLTILIFLWVITTTHRYVLDPVTWGAREALVWLISDTQQDLHETDNVVASDGQVYRRIENGTFIPKYVYDTVRENPGDTPAVTANDFYERYVNLTYLRPWVAIPVFLLVFIVVLYLLGRFMAAGIGRFFWNLFERVILRLPLVRNVYSSVKQVSDFLFTEREIEYTRVVAVEYPRKGIWSLGMVTGESLLDIRSAANEPVLSVLIPTSPMPVTGYTVTVLKSETIDLNISIDQAFQFIVSCGVVIPPQQLQDAIEEQHKLLEIERSGEATDEQGDGADESQPTDTSSPETDETREDSEPAESKN